MDFFLLPSTLTQDKARRLDTNGTAAVRHGGTRWRDVAALVGEKQYDADLPAALIPG
jgi:hypothetical protein